MTVIPFPAFIPLHPAHTPTHISPLYFMSMGHTYKFFGFYISYTILIFSLSISTYQLCYLFPVPFTPSPLPFQAANPACDIHFCDSVPVLLVCLVHFWFWSFFLGSVVDSCEFVVTLLFIYLIFFFFLEKSLQHFI